MSPGDAAWSTTRDDAHPVHWTPADQGGPDPEASRYVTVSEALRRLAGYGVELEALEPGKTYRTTFAFYVLEAAAS